jgi:hypothetical protein
MLFLWHRRNYRAWPTLIGVGRTSRRSGGSSIHGVALLPPSVQFLGLGDPPPGRRPEHFIPFEQLVRAHGRE